MILDVEIYFNCSLFSKRINEVKLNSNENLQFSIKEIDNLIIIPEIDIIPDSTGNFVEITESITGNKYEGAFYNPCEEIEWLKKP